MPDLKPRSAYQENVEIEQRKMAKEQGGIREDYQQDKLHQKETQIKHNECPVSSQPLSYTEEARRMDQLGDHFDKQSKAIDKTLERGEKLSNEKCSKISELEAEADKAAKSLNKDKEKHAKKEHKLDSKLHAQEVKTMQMAKELAAEQKEIRQIEAQQVQEICEKESEARRLANQLANKREEDRKFAEQKMHELKEAENEMNIKVSELERHQAKELHELEIKQKEMKVNVETARKSMQALKERHDREKGELLAKKNELEKLKSEAYTTRQLNEKHIKEREGLEQRLAELDEKAEQERQRLNELNKEQANLQQDIQVNKQKLAQDESTLHDTEKLVQTKEAEKTTVESHAKQQLENEELALKKARDLAGKTAEERRDLQKDVERLTQEEKKAKTKLGQLEQQPHIKVEERPVTVDVFKRERYQTTEPVVTEAKVEKTETCTENKSIGEKIVDGVKNLF